MALQITGAAQVKLYWSINGTLAINVFGARVNGSPTFDQAMANTLGAAVKSAFTANMGALAPSTTQLVRVGVRDIRVANLPEFRDTGGIVSGTGTGDALPAGLAVCVTIRTSGSGKSFRGRSYISGWNETQNSPTGLIVAGASAAAVTFVNAINTAMASSGMTLAVLSYPSERKVMNETTFHDDGTSTVRKISETSAKTGSLSVMTALESRNSLWEHQRRRDNGRGASPTSLIAPVFHATPEV